MRCVGPRQSVVGVRVGHGDLKHRVYVYGDVAQLLVVLEDDLLLARALTSPGA